MEAIALQSNIRANLNALTTIEKQSNTTSERLATGKDVNSMIDNPTNFFAARGLNDRAGALNSRLDVMGKAIQTINAAANGIDAIRSLLANAKAIVTDAMSKASVTSRRELGEQFNTVVSQIDLIAQDSNFEGVNLLNNNQTLSVEFGELNGSSSLRVKGLDLQGPTNGSSTVTNSATITRASAASTGSIAAVASRASIAALASSASTGSIAAIASQASQASVAFVPSAGSQASAGTIGSTFTRASVASRASAGSTVAFASQAAQGSIAAVKSSASFGSVASLGSFAEVHSIASAASTGSVASSSVSFTQQYAFALQIDANDTSGTVGISKHSSGDIQNRNGDHRIDFGGSAYLAELQSLSNAIDTLDDALETQNARLATNLNIITVRQTFSEDMIGTLEAGADNLVLADINEEAANLTALQTRQSLAIQSLSLSSTQSQQVLRLLS